MPSSWYIDTLNKCQSLLSSHFFKMSEIKCPDVEDVHSMSLNKKTKVAKQYEY